MISAAIETDAKLDLVFERVVDVPRELVWEAWTKPEHLKKWFTPAPWSTVDCTIDLRPGGIFRTVMRSPEGEDHSNTGCYLDVVPGEKLVWTSALGPGFRPLIRPTDSNKCDELYFTAFVLFEALDPQRTKYTAIAVHADEASAQRHEAMGFHHGWGKALEQLVELMKPR